MLQSSQFHKAIELTQLVSIDLIVVDEDNKVLVGKRRNDPAKGHYFVPGSRIYKYEQLNDAVKRISNYELGITINDFAIKGIYDHIYDNNFLDNQFGTHYICIAITCQNIDNDLKKIICNKMKDQHEDSVWMDIGDLLNNNLVHKYTKNYFIEYPDNKFVDKKE